MNLSGDPQPLLTRQADASTLGMSERTQRKAADLDIAARALFERYKASRVEMDVRDWESLPDDRAREPLSRTYFRDEVRVAVEALWRAGRLI